MDVSSSTSLQELDEKDYEEEPLNDEQREVMEDIWLKADEMGNIYIDLVASMISFN